MIALLPAFLMVFLTLANGIAGAALAVHFSSEARAATAMRRILARLHLMRLSLAALLTSVIVTAEVDALRALGRLPTGSAGHVLGQTGAGLLALFGLLLLHHVLLAHSPEEARAERRRAWRRAVAGRPEGPGGPKP